MSTAREGEIEEKRRLFYVALTCARDHVNVSAPSGYYVAGRQRTDRHSYAHPTRFITPSVQDRFHIVAPEFSLGEEEPAIDVDDAESIRSRIRAMWD
ncbi:MAG: hypothetical protein IH988_01265 [Planctomycetes bacterium]|nr:hypothetical protein [Planctomycetota bacterium]